MKISVQPEWCLSLPLQQQSVLFLAGRGPDGIGRGARARRPHSSLNDAARRFWDRQDRAQQARDAERDRHIIARGGDCTAHVAAWELFRGLADMLGEERALALCIAESNSERQE